MTLSLITVETEMANHKEDVAYLTVDLSRLECSEKLSSHESPNI